MTRLLAIHGMKRGWVGATVADGLIRDSAAWFIRPEGSDDTELVRSLAAVVFLALAPATRTLLAGLTGPSEYAAFFAANERMLPAVVLFADEPTGYERWHRYVWPGPPKAGMTFPYTKVARAGRQVRFTDRSTCVVKVRQDLVVSAEAAADELPTSRIGVTELTRLDADDQEPVIRAGADKLSRVCAALAAVLRRQAAPYIESFTGDDLQENSS
jgi:hypothetical protein